MAHTLLGQLLARRDGADAGERQTEDRDGVERGQERGHDAGVAEVRLDGLDAELGVVGLRGDEGGERDGNECGGELHDCGVVGIPGVRSAAKITEIKECASQRTTVKEREKVGNVASARRRGLYTPRRAWQLRTTSYPRSGYGARSALTLSWTPPTNSIEVS